MISNFSSKIEKEVISIQNHLQYSEKSDSNSETFITMTVSTMPIQPSAFLTPIPFTRTSKASCDSVFLGSRCVRKHSPFVVQHTQRTRITFAKMSIKPGEKDLLIVGAGQLGRLIGRQWQYYYPESKVYAETKTTRTHENLQNEYGFIPLTTSSEEAETHSMFPYAVFCAPPGRGTSGEEYAKMVRKAAKRGKRFVFTSSTSVYGKEGGNLTEKSMINSEAKLKDAEIAAKEGIEGMVVRLAGLYLRYRGAHCYYMKVGNIPGDKNGMLNLIHYDDAASAVIKALRLEQIPSSEERCFLACAKEMNTKKEVVDVSYKHYGFKGWEYPKMEDNGVKQEERKFDNEWTRNILRWRPRFESFVDFMEWDDRVGMAEDMATVNGGFINVQKEKLAKETPSGV